MYRLDSVTPLFTCSTQIIDRLLMVWLYRLFPSIPERYRYNQPRDFDPLAPTRILRVLVSEVALVWRTSEDRRRHPRAADEQRTGAGTLRFLSYLSQTSSSSTLCSKPSHTGQSSNVSLVIFEARWTRRFPGSCLSGIFDRVISFR
jgi:hypothetical protein